MEETTKWYDKNRSNDPGALQGRNEDGQFTEDTIGNKKSEEQTKKLKEVNFDKEYEYYLNDSPHTMNSLPEFKKFLNDGFKSGTQESQKLVLDLIKTDRFRYLNDGSSYCSASGGTISINLNQDSGLDDTYWHEHWHAFDINFYGTQLAKNEFNEEFEKFKQVVDKIYEITAPYIEKKIKKVLPEGRITEEDLETLREDYEFGIKGAEDEYWSTVEEYRKQEKIIRKELGEFSQISDFVSMATDNRLNFGGFGHCRSYWQLDEDNARKEAIANIGSLISTGKKNRFYKFVIEFFPKTYEAIGGVLNGKK